MKHYINPHEQRAHNKGGVVDAEPSRIRGSRFGILPVAVLSGSCEHGCSRQLPLTSEQPMDGL